eukprot:7510761-Alexandrium_andersonii.AAC.1
MDLSGRASASVRVGHARSAPWRSKGCRMSAGMPWSDSWLWTIRPSERDCPISCAIQVSAVTVVSWSG